MQPTQHHLNAAERWIEANGYPTTDAELARMGREVAQEATRVVEHMANKTLESLNMAQRDRMSGVSTLGGMQGREFLQSVYSELAGRL